ncbi:MAG: 3-ketoacyl-ACP reductase, partial [Dehalococcoidia bacterium]
MDAARDGPLAGRVAIVTGAGRRLGIGAAICRALAAAGADICFTH